MALARYLRVAVAGAVCALLPVSCSLNPQPLPPEAVGQTGDGGVAANPPPPLTGSDGGVAAADTGAFVPTDGASSQGSDVSDSGNKMTDGSAGDADGGGGDADGTSMEDASLDATDERRD